MHLALGTVFNNMDNLGLLPPSSPSSPWCMAATQAVITHMSHDSVTFGNLNLPSSKSFYRRLTANPAHLGLVRGLHCHVPPLPCTVLTRPCIDTLQSCHQLHQQSQSRASASQSTRCVCTAVACGGSGQVVQGCCRRRPRAHCRGVWDQQNTVSVRSGAHAVAVQRSQDASIVSRCGCRHPVWFASSAAELRTAFQDVLAAWSPSKVGPFCVTQGSMVYDCIGAVLYVLYGCVRV
jgi:hypothetical protein